MMFVLSQGKDQDEQTEALKEKLRRQEIMINKYEKDLMMLQMSQASEQMVSPNSSK
jgi:hypothetical protein